MKACLDDLRQVMEETLMAAYRRRKAADTEMQPLNILAQCQVTWSWFSRSRKDLGPTVVSPLLKRGEAFMCHDDARNISMATT
jgi:hypothetical protein